MQGLGTVEWLCTSASVGGLLVVWVNTFALALIYFAWATSRVKRSMEEPPTWLITHSPLHAAASSLLPIAEICRLGTVCICLQVLQLYFFFFQLQNRPVALWCM